MSRERNRRFDITDHPFLGLNILIIIACIVMTVMYFRDKAMMVEVPGTFVESCTTTETDEDGARSDVTYYIYDYEYEGQQYRHQTQNYVADEKGEVRLIEINKNDPDEIMCIEGYLFAMKWIVKVTVSFDAFLFLLKIAVGFRRKRFLRDFRR